MTTRRAFVGSVSAAFAALSTGCVHDEDADVVPVSQATVHEGDSFESDGIEYEVDVEVMTETIPTVEVGLTATNRREAAADVPDDFVVVDGEDEVYRASETSGFENDRTLEPGASSEYGLSYTVPADRLDRDYYFGRDGDYVRLST